MDDLGANFISHVPIAKRVTPLNHLISSEDLFLQSGLYNSAPFSSNAFQWSTMIPDVLDWERRMDEGFTVAKRRAVSWGRSEPTVVENYSESVSVVKYCFLALHKAAAAKAT